MPTSVLPRYTGENSRGVKKWIGGLRVLTWYIASGLLKEMPKICKLNLVLYPRRPQRTQWEDTLHVGYGTEKKNEPDSHSRVLVICDSANCRQEASFLQVTMSLSGGRQCWPRGRRLIGNLKRKELRQSVNILVTGSWCRSLLGRRGEEVRATAESSEVLIVLEKGKW